MYCPKCGKQCKDGAMFCPYCGEKLNSVQNEDSFTDNAVETSAKQVDSSEPEVVESPTEESPKKKRWIIWLIVCVAVVCVVIIVAVVVRRIGNTDQQFQDHMDVGYECMNGGDYDEAVAEFTEAIQIDSKVVEPYQQLAAAYIELDEPEKAEETYDDARNIILAVYNTSDETGEAYADQSDEAAEGQELLSGAEDLYIAAIYYYGNKEDLDSVEELTDEITAMLTDEEDIQEVTDASLIYLESVDKLNVFDGVDVLFSGVAPIGEAEVVVNNDFDPHLCSYTLDKDSDLSDGDVVTVSFEIKDEDAFVEEYGELPKNVREEYTVSGLDSYIIDMSQLSDENLDELKNDSFDKAKSDFDTDNKYYLGGHSGIANWAQLSSIERGDDFILENIYFLSPKEPGSSQIVFIYSVSITLNFAPTWNREPESARNYFAIAYPQLIQEESGNLVGISKYNITLGDESNTDSLYKKYISNTKDDYIATIYDADLNVVE